MNYTDLKYDALKTRFDEDGYVAVRKYLDDQSVQEVHTAVERYVDQVVPTLPPTDVFYEQKGEQSTLKQLPRMSEHDSFFRSIIHESPLRTLAERLLADEVVPYSMQYFDKPPRIGKPTPPHQDGFYFMLEPCEALTMWLALDQVDEANGCVRYLRGSHRDPMRRHGKTKTLGFSQGIIDYGTADDRRREVALPALPGDLLVHHALTVHRADGNQTEDRHRRALGIVYFAARASVDEARKAAYQESLNAELVEQGKV